MEIAFFSPSDVFDVLNQQPKVRNINGTEFPDFIPLRHT